jgi:hypothetical protein
MRDPRARLRAESPRKGGEKLPQGDAHQPNLPVGPVASTRDTLPRCALRGVGFPILKSRLIWPRTDSCSRVTR